MSKFTMMWLAAVPVFAGVSACGGPPWTLAQSPTEITLRWYPDDTDSSVADGVAQTHCASASKNAELISYTQNGSAQIGKYRCR